MLVELGKELRKARKSMSLDAAAGPAKISATYLHKLERGVVSNPSPRVLTRIAVALEVHYLRLMQLAGYLDEMQLAATRMREAAPQPHPLAGQQLTREEWRKVNEFIKELFATRSP